MKYRKYSIMGINVLLIMLIIKAWFFDPISDTNAIFSLMMFIGIILINAYIILIYQLTSKGERHQIYIEILFYILLLLPFIFIFLYF
jgi:hypothetical protein